MKSDKKVWVERRGADHLTVARIFRSTSAAIKAHVFTSTMPYGEAVSLIRHAIFIRSEGYCEICAGPIREKTMQMHERKHRGQGGEISLENSLAICAVCHARAHKERNPQWTK